MTIRTEHDLEALIANQIPESQTLEFKSQTSLNSPGEKRELLKDVTGMANGGGGTLIVGIADGGRDVAVAIQALQDSVVQGQIEQVLRSGSSPPVLAEVRRIEVSDGHVLVIDVERSPLGPNRVEHGTHLKYYKRSSTIVTEMTEQEIRDAYLLAARHQEHRVLEWQRHSLPPAPVTDWPTVAVSALPHSPLRDIFQVRDIDEAAFKSPPGLAPYFKGLGMSFDLATYSPWLNGISIAEPPSSHGHPTTFRLHRDGALVYQVSLGAKGFDTDTPSHVLNAMLLYAAWVWDQIGMTQPVDLLIQFTGLEGCNLTGTHGSGTSSAFRRPPGTPDWIELNTEVLPVQLSDAPSRHEVLHQFADRVSNAFGFAGQDVGFLFGVLETLHLADARYVVEADHIKLGGKIIARIDDDGLVTGGATQTVFGYMDRGVVLDGGGATIAHTVFATGPGCPKDGCPRVASLSVNHNVRVAPKQSGVQGTGGSRPVATGQWSSTSLDNLVASDRAQV